MATAELKTAKAQLATIFDCSSAGRIGSVVDSSATFLLSNRMPQAPNNNPKTWVNLENYCRTLGEAGKLPNHLCRRQKHGAGQLLESRGGTANRR